MQEKARDIDPAAEDQKQRKRLSSFSVLLVVAAMTVVGIAFIPLLNISYDPINKQTSLTVNFNWGNASARVVEQEVTSPLEGILATIRGVDEISSYSYKGGGHIDVAFKKGVNFEAARFEIASQIRNIYSDLPQGVQYPYISASTSGRNVSPVISYELNAPMPSDKIEKIAKESFQSQLSRIKDVGSIRFSGVTPFEYIVSFDPDRAAVYGISAQDISSAFNIHFSSEIVGNTKIEKSGIAQNLSIVLSGTSEPDFDKIPIANRDGKIFYFKDFASVVYKEVLPTSYFRINGLNTINMTIYPEEGVNTIQVVKQIKESIDELSANLPENYSLRVSFDASEQINKELNKILLRSVLSLLILLGFVLLVSRSFKYLLVITITLIANILIAIIFYKLLGVSIHMYSLVGVTVSLGLIIDASIIMVDHYGYTKNLKAFSALLGALLTTIAALSVIFLLPKEQKVNFTDFVAIIIINLSVALAVTLLFVPALMDKMSMKQGVTKTSLKRKRRIIRSNRRYIGYILWGKRNKWLLITALVLVFGFPVYLLPSKIEKNDSKELSGIEKFYNKTLGSKWYQDNKKIFETAFGGTLYQFSKNTSGSGFYGRGEPEKAVIDIRAGMAEGCSVQQLDAVVREMENFLSQFDEIEMFQANVWDYDNAHIRVTFKPEATKTAVPLFVKQQIISQAARYGGATWNINGIDDNNFNNNVSSGLWQANNIELYGYNYDALYGFAERIIDSLEGNQRVKDIQIKGANTWDRIKTEFYMEYDQENMLLRNITPYDFFSYLDNKLYSGYLPPVYDGDMVTNVRLVSSERETFDVWHLENDMVQIKDANVKLSEFGSIEKRLSGNNIYKRNQVYSINVSYDFIGSSQLASEVIERTIKTFNQEILPVGFIAKARSWGMNFDEKMQWVMMLLLVIVIIYFICAIMLESLIQPMVIILMIPISYVGLFLTFAIGKFTFDQGGYASFIMLTAITINAGIYLIYEYNMIVPNFNGSKLRAYMRSYNRKVVPILLTVISTILGLIPFLINGKGETFWFSFAIGTMGGMLFSIVAFIFYLPVFLPLRKKRL